MSSMSENVTRIANAKTAIKNAINAKGGTLTTEKIESYAAAVSSLPTGSTDTWYKCATVTPPSSGGIIVAGANVAYANGNYAFQGGTGTSRTWTNDGGCRIFYSGYRSVWVIEYISQEVWLYRTTQELGSDSNPWGNEWTIEMATEPSPTVTQGQSTTGSWTGYLATISSTGITYAQSVTTGLSFSSTTPVVNGIYNQDVTKRIYEDTLVASNIKKDVVILGVTGSYEGGGGGSMSIYQCSGCWIDGYTIVVSGAGDSEVNGTYYPYTGTSGTGRIWRTLNQAYELYWQDGSPAAWLIRRISGNWTFYRYESSDDPWGGTWDIHGSSTSPAPSVVRGSAVTAGWKGYALTQDSTTKAWNKAATETTMPAYTYIKPEYGNAYTADTSMLISKFYPGGVQVELWQDYYYGYAATLSFVFTDVNNESDHQWITGTYTGGDHIIWYVTPGTYYIGGSGFEGGAYYSTDNGANWTSLSVLYDQTTYKNLSTDGTNPATVTIPATGMSKFLVKY